MKRFVSRHLSVRSHEYSYVPLSTSEPQLNIEKGCPSPPPPSTVHSKEKKVTSPRDSNARKRRWFYLRKRKKKHDNDFPTEDDAEKPSADFEVAVEVSPSGFDGGLDEATLPDSETYVGSEQALGIQSTVNKAVCHGSAPMKEFPCRLGRRFAICEELEREITMEDGTNLRKSRKNLVIRQVLHDLLLL